MSDVLHAAKLRAILAALREDLKPELATPNARLRADVMDMLLTRLATLAENDGGAEADGSAAGGHECGAPLGRWIRDALTGEFHRDPLPVLDNIPTVLHARFSGQVAKRWVLANAFAHEFHFADENSKRLRDGGIIQQALLPIIPQG